MKPKDLPSMKTSKKPKGNPKDPVGAEHFIGSKGHSTPGRKGSQKPGAGTSPMPKMKKAGAIGNDADKMKGSVRNRGENAPAGKMPKMKAPKKPKK